MSRIFSVPPGYGPGKLGTFAVLSFALAALTLVPALDRDAGIPDVSTLTEARGRVAYLSSQKYGVRFRLHGRTEMFDYPSKAKGYGVVESALLSAGSREVAVLYNAIPRKPWFSADPYYDVWQLGVDGKIVRTAAESKEGWRSDNAIGPWLFASFLFLGCYLSLLAVRAHRSKKIC